MAKMAFAKQGSRRREPVQRSRDPCSAEPTPSRFGQASLVGRGAASRAVVGQGLTDETEGSLLAPAPPLGSRAARVAPVNRRCLVVRVSDRRPAPPLGDVSLEPNSGAVGRV